MDRLTIRTCNWWPNPWFYMRARYWQELGHTLFYLSSRIGGTCLRHLAVLSFCGGPIGPERLALLRFVGLAGCWADCGPCPHHAHEHALTLRRSDALGHG